MGWLKIVSNLLSKDNKGNSTEVDDSSIESTGVETSPIPDKKETPTIESPILNFEDYRPVDTSNYNKLLSEVRYDTLRADNDKELSESVDQAMSITNTDSDNSIDHTNDLLRSLLMIVSSKASHDIELDSIDRKANLFEHQLELDRYEDLLAAIRRYNSDIDEVNRASSSESSTNDTTETTSNLSDDIKKDSEGKSLLDRIKDSLGLVVMSIAPAAIPVLLAARRVIKNTIKRAKKLGKLLVKPIKAIASKVGNIFKKVKFSKPVQKVGDILKSGVKKVTERLAETKLGKYAAERKAKRVAAKKAAVATAKKTAAKTTAKTVGKFFGKVIPFVGVGIGVAEMISAGRDMYRAYKSGDSEAMKNAKLKMAGGGLDLMAGAASFVPVIGTAAAGVLGAAGTAMTTVADVKKEIHASERDLVNEELETDISAPEPSGPSTEVGLGGVVDEITPSMADKGVDESDRVTSAPNMVLTEESTKGGSSNSTAKNTDGLSLVNEGYNITNNFNTFESHTIIENRNTKQSYI